MITKVQIENFKSIEKLSLPLGRVNVLIGENGCGKTNILEGIAMAAGALDVKNLEEHLANRGVRVTPPLFMLSSFEKVDKIHISIDSSENFDFVVDFNYNNQPYNNWVVNYSSFMEEYEKSLAAHKEEIEKVANDLDQKLEVLKREGDKETVNEKKKEYKFAKTLSKSFYLNRILNGEESKKISPIENFVIYAPENHFLRKTDELGTVEPLGYRGEGLIKLISVLHKEKPEAIEEIKKHLRLISWFEDFEIVNDAFTGSYVKIRDAYLGKDIYYPNLKSTNEGFLYLLFYLALFIAEYTPKFFAIDNIDNALNPKLCRELVKVLTQLAKKYDKQVIFTTHNPAVLDGLNLDDEEQRLFVVYRDAEGHTKARRVKKRETPEGYEPMRMSEQYMNGFIGGLPKNF